MDKIALDVLLHTLQTNLKDEPWLDLLRTLNITGTANSLQLQAALHLSRDRLPRLIEQVNQLARRLPPLVVEFDHPIARPGVRGRAPTVYLLDETGAALLRATGEDRNARTCGLKDDLPIAHALAMLDVHLCATAAGVPIETDRKLLFGAGKDIRPDHLITLDGRRYLIEIEQAASSDTLRRLNENVLHRVAFFTSPESRDVEPVVRMLINLPRGKAFQRTCHYWRVAVESVFESLDTPPYRLLALPLNEFLQEPIWNLPDIEVDPRWLDLSEPPQPAARSQARTVEAAPEELLTLSPHDSALILNALWQDYRWHTARQPSTAPRPDRESFMLWRIIYVASHDPALSALDRAGFPHASLYLLKRYLQLHEPLKKDLTAALKRGQNAGRWNVTLIRQWMQAVLNIFLEYHGLYSSDTLQVRAIATEWASTTALHALDVDVQIAPEVLRENDQPLGRDEVARTERALAWVLRALFQHARHLDLGNPPVFWRGGEKHE
jgi:hypothetical protein